MVQELQNKNIKYLHIMIVNSIKHNESIIKMINDSELNFNKEEHVFIITNKDLYESLKKYNNVYYDNSIIKNMKTLKKYSKMCEYIFFHSLNIKYRNFLFLPKKVANKIIWITWGHDLYRKKPNTFFNVVKEKIYNITKGIIKKYRVKQFYAIGIGFKYDIIEARKRFGQDIRILPLIYGYENGRKGYIDSIINTTKANKSEKQKVMIGHCAYPFLNHINIMKKLEKFKNEDIIISLVLSYGNMEYARKVEEYAVSVFGKDKVEIIKDLMDEQEYIKYLNTVDICILDYTHQAALGNLWRLLYLEKKVYLNKKGILKIFSDFEGAETYNVDMIDNMTYKEFIKKLEDPESCKNSVKFYMDERNIVNMWKNSLREINNGTDK